MIALLLFVFAASAQAALIKFEYDAVGNLIAGQGKYYEYNNANQLVLVRKDAPDGSIIAEYVYDYQGQRVKKTENGVTTYYIGKHYEERKGKTVNEKTSYFFANGQRVTRKTTKDGGAAEINYYLNNHLGSADAVVDEQGAVVERVRYLPFGEYRTQPQPKERYAYTGKERDAATDLYYYEARYYNPGIRRFTQADTVTPDLYDPQSLNRYAYARNSPLVYNDPSGHFFDVVLDIAFIANDIRTLVTDPSSRTAINFIALGADVAGAVIPGATGLGAGVKAAANVVSNGAAVYSAAEEFVASDKTGGNWAAAAGEIGLATLGVGGKGNKAVSNTNNISVHKKRTVHHKRTVNDVDAYQDIENYLGSRRQTSINPYSGKKDNGRIWVRKPDGGYLAVRMGDHEIKNINDFHYHLEYEFEYNPSTGRTWCPTDEKIHVNRTRRKR